MSFGKRLGAWTHVVPTKTIRALVNSIYTLFFEKGPFKVKLPLNKVITVKGRIDEFEFLLIVKDLVESLNKEINKYELTATFQTAKGDYEYFMLRLEPSEWFAGRKVSEWQQWNPASHRDFQQQHYTTLAFDEFEKTMNIHSEEVRGNRPLYIDWTRFNLPQEPSDLDTYDRNFPRLPNTGSANTTGSESFFNPGPSGLHKH